MSDTGVCDDAQTTSPRPADVSFFTPAPAIALSRYNRQILIPQISVTGQQRIQDARVLVVGLGGLGAPASLYLAGAGVGTLGLLDDDTVETSNLHRQIVHRETSAADKLTKVVSAVRGCRALNSAVNLVGHELRLESGSGKRVLDIFSAYDIVLDCTDNPATRYMINDVCVVLNKTLVSGAAQRLEGQLMVLNYPMPDQKERGPCYRCLFPTPPSPEMVRGCSEIGILGPVVGTIGTMMASETLRLIVRADTEHRKPSMLLFNAWPTEAKHMWRAITMRRRRDDCIACGDSDAVQAKGSQKIHASSIENGQLDYIAFCGRAEDIKLLDQKHRITAAAFIKQMTQHSHHSSTSTMCIVDTRESHEIEIGPQLHGSLNIPLSRIIRANGNIEELHQPLQDGRDVCFVCQQGNDSQVAAKYLLDHLAAKQKSVAERFIGDVEGGYVAIEKVVEAGKNQVG